MTLPRTKDIYLDTMLWNVLCDQGIDPAGLVRQLAAKNTYLAPGIHIFYELAKTFRNPDEESRERGKLLFSYFRKFLESDTHCVKDHTELLPQEMRAVKLRSPISGTMLSEEDRSLVLQEADKLAEGEVSQRTRDLIQEQYAFAKSARSNQREHLNLRAEMKAYLKNIPETQLEPWLQTEGTGPEGVHILSGHILRRFPEISETEALEYATALLNPLPKRFARGAIRSDLYYNWRCANRDSVPKDLIDDMYHVLNAVYCDVYATAERGQAEYAHLILTPETRVAVHPGGPHLDQWIESLC